MQTMNQSLFELYQKGFLLQEDAVMRSFVPEEMVQMMQKAQAAVRRA
jgi:Tfp pilus assembly ATPase PilU